MHPRRTALLLIAPLLFAAVACGDRGGGEGVVTGGQRIVVGSKLDTEAQLLGHLLAVALEDRGYDVVRRIPLGSTQLTRRALETGAIDIYWEFTGSGLGLLGEPAVGDPVEAYERVKALDERNGITWLPAAAMNDTYALAVKGGGPVAATDLSGLAGHLEREPGTRLCVDPEGGFREDVLPRLEEIYGIVFAGTRQLGYELVAAAVAGGECDVGIVYSTSALVVKHDLRVLADDRRAFGAYTPAPTLRTERLPRWPRLADDLAGLTGALDTPTITLLNARVDIDRVPAAQVARQFLEERGLVGATERRPG